MLVAVTPVCFARVDRITKFTVSCKSLFAFTLPLVGTRVDARSVLGTIMVANDATVNGFARSAASTEARVARARIVARASHVAIRISMAAAVPDRARVQWLAKNAVACPASLAFALYQAYSRSILALQHGANTVLEVAATVVLVTSRVRMIRRRLWVHFQLHHR